jgi:hypothetical protein
MIWCVSKEIIMKNKDETNPAYSGMSAQLTFLGQLKTNLVVLIGQFSVLAHKLMIHVPVLIIHALQKKN